MQSFACLYAPGNLPLIVECARQFSPYLEEIPPDGVLFNITGLNRIFGEPPRIADEIARRTGVPAALAIASNADTARLAAWGLAGITLIPRGEERRILSTLPINLLQASPEIAETLEQWGIRTLGQLGKLPPLGVTARLGTEGIRLWHLARGECDRLLKTARDPLRFSNEQELEYPLEMLEPLAFVLSQMLQDICERLKRASLAAVEIRLQLVLENEMVHARTLRFPLPISDAAALLKLLYLDLEKQPLNAPIVKVVLDAEPAQPRIEQHSLLQPTAPQPEKMELTIARIAAFVGAENIGTPALENSFRPDGFQMLPFRAVAASTGPSPVPEQPRAGLRRFRPPQVIQVQVSDGHPLRLHGATIQGVVSEHSGPWKTSGNWWSTNGWAREEWDVALATGTLLRIYYDLKICRWFLDGIYD